MHQYILEINNSELNLISPFFWLPWQPKEKNNSKIDTQEHSLPKLLTRTEVWLHHYPGCHSHRKQYNTSWQLKDLLLTNTCTLYI